jgi:flavin-dependent dehydrogenase
MMPMSYLGRHGLHLSDYKLEGHPIRWFDSKSIFSAQHVLLVGDAAGTDALFGEGISIALGYGRFAAQAIQSAFAENNFSFSGYKRSILQADLGKALRRRTWLARIFYWLRSTCFQAFVWRRMGWLVAWAMRAFFIGWARRQENRQRADI